MERLKDEFTFQFKKQTINVKLLGGVYCAIFGEIAKPLQIEFSKSGEMHRGKISDKEGKFLSWLPESAFEEIEPKAVIIKLRAFLNSLNI